MDQVLRALKTGEPKRVHTSEGNSPILVFGSDGGGGRFALRLDDGQVLYLASGAVHDGVFDGVNNSQVRTLAPDFPAFLERVLEDLRAFVNDEAGWEYMAQ